MKHFRPKLVWILLPRLLHSRRKGLPGRTFSFLFLFRIRLQPFWRPFYFVSFDLSEKQFNSNTGNSAFLFFPPPPIWLGILSFDHFLGRFSSFRSSRCFNSSQNWFFYLFFFFGRRRNATALEKFHYKITKYQLYDKDDPLVDNILRLMATEPIVHVGTYTNLLQ